MRSILQFGMRALAILLVAAAVLNACKQLEGYQQAPVQSSEANEAQCGSEGFKHLLGKDKSALAAVDFPHPTRILAPNSVMTMDHRSDRLNVHLDRFGKVTKIICG